VLPEVPEAAGAGDLPESPPVDEACRDPDVLRGWVIRAVGVASVVELFGLEVGEPASS
jgi:hypothetical protein